MNNHILSNTRVLLIATMLSAMMLTASSMPSLISTTAYAQQDIASGVNERVNEVLTQKLNPNSESGEEEDTSDGDAAAATADEQEGAGEEEEEEATATPTDEEEDTSDGDATATATPVNPQDSEINLDSNSEEDTSRVEEDDSVTVDPVTQLSVQPDLNVNVDTALVMDEEDCEEARNEVLQANGQASDQQTGSEGRVGDNDIYVSPKLQLSEHVALNVNADVDVVMVPGCNPVDDVTQVNAGTQGQELDNNDNLKSSPSGTVRVPAHQRADAFQGNIGVNKDVILPVL